MKNGGVVQTAESFKGKKRTESRGNKGMMPLPDFSPDNPAYDGRVNAAPPNAGSPPSNLIEGGQNDRVGREASLSGGQGRRQVNPATLIQRSPLGYGCREILTFENLIFLEILLGITRGATISRPPRRRPIAGAGRP